MVRKDQTLPPQVKFLETENKKLHQTVIKLQMEIEGLKLKKLYE